MATMKKSWIKQHDGILIMGGKGDDTFTFDVPSGYQFTGFDAKVLAGRYKAGVRVSSQPGRGETGKGKKAVIHWWFDGGDRPFIKYECSASFDDGVVGKSQRALLVMCDLAYGGLEHFRTLYNWIETAGMATVLNILRDDYMHVTSLTGTAATATNFVTSLSSLAGKSGIKAVDAVLMLHGRENEICFRGGSLTGGPDGTIRSQLGARNLGGKLRACFSTCCWGETVADDLVASGFLTACGSKDVYANGAYGIPTALHSWESGDTFSTAVAKANNQVIMAACDAIARQLNPLFATANSYWTISGNRYKRITSKGS